MEMNLRNMHLEQSPQVMLMQTKSTILEGCLMMKSEDLEGNLISMHFSKT